MNFLAFASSDTLCCHSRSDCRRPSHPPRRQSPIFDLASPNHSPHPHTVQSTRGKSQGLPSVKICFGKHQLQICLGLTGTPIKF
jgi:hypothetical protein